MREEDYEEVELKRFTFDIETQIPMGTAPEYKSAIFHALWGEFNQSVQVKFADQFTVAPGVCVFRFTIKHENLVLALHNVKVTAEVFIPAQYPYTVVHRSDVW